MKTGMQSQSEETGRMRAVRAGGVSVVVCSETSMIETVVEGIVGAGRRGAMLGALED